MWRRWSFWGARQGLRRYPYEEPLREWKIQAFHEGETLTLEVVTFESWREEAVKLLDDLVVSMEQLVQRPWEELDV